MSAPRDAATVMLLRPSSECVQVFMQERVSTMAFAAGAVVFPGGSVDAKDAVGSEGWALPTAPDLGDGASGAVVSAAIRETFEECGVLLARPESCPTTPAAFAGEATLGGHTAQGAQTDQGMRTAHGGHPPSGTALEAHRAALTRHQTSLSAVLTDLGFVPDLDRLVCVDRWVTPEGLPRRYDTRFLAAQAPATQLADDLSTETVRSFWAAPSRVLDAFARGKIALMQPTWAQLRRLAAAPTLEAAMAPAGTGITRHTLRRVGGRELAWGEGTEEYIAAGVHLL